MVLGKQEALLCIENVMYLRVLSVKIYVDNLRHEEIKWTMSDDPKTHSTSNFFDYVRYLHRTKKRREVKVTIVAAEVEQKSDKKLHIKTLEVILP